MLDYLRHRLATASLKARYQRLVHQRLLELTEAGPQPVSDDPGRWQQVGADARGLSFAEAADVRTRAREFVHANPHARNILRLMEAYVAGPELMLAPRLIPTTADAQMALKSMREMLAPEAQRLLDQANQWWKRFMTENQRHFSFREHARRTWRDGETFLRVFHQQQGPPSVRFIDPEWIGPTREEPDSQGILTEPFDVETPTAYLRLDTATGDLAEAVPASDVLHTRIGADSNEKRGLSLFAPLLARKLQASIVLWRKVQGSAAEALRTSEANAYDTTSAGVRRERFQPGTILTTNQSTEIEFLHPKTNFTDAVPLGRMLLLSVAAGAGLPEFMLTSDASNSNYASTMVAEGPAVKLFSSEQQFFANEWSMLWRIVMQSGIDQGELPSDLFERIEPAWTFPVVVNRDRSKERLTDARLVARKVLSRAEVARRDGVDPSVMRCEIAEET